MGIISLSGVVYSHSVRVAGDAFDEAIINYVRRNYGMLIGEATAEEIKKAIGTAFPGNAVREIEAKGRNLAEGIPRAFTISSNEVLEALAEPLNQIVQAVKNALEQTRRNWVRILPTAAWCSPAVVHCLMVWIVCWPRRPACR